MSKAQLLLLTLVVIVLGVAVAIGAGLFTDSAVAANRDALSSDLLSFAARAHEYYRRPTIFNGGGGSFAGLTPDQTGMAKLTNLPGGKNPNGVYSVVAPGTSTEVMLEGVGTILASDQSYVTVRIIVRASLPDSVYQVH